MKRNLFFLILLLILCVPTRPVQAVQPAAGTVVLSLPDDDYAALAAEIAYAEALPLVQSWDAALAESPAFVLWVAAPQNLSDQAMVAAGLALKQSPALPSVGIISGITQDEARNLWQRGRALRKAGNLQRFFAANGEFPTAGIMSARLITFPSGQPQTTPLNRDTLAAALRDADYLTFTGHGSDDYLRIDPDTKLLSSDLPDLPPVVVGTNSCQTLRVWSADSIALSFIRKGAAAYAGFVYSPLEGYMIGQFQDLPLRYAWPDFPIGAILALQTRGTLQGFANFPYHFLLGDPRIALRAAPPYELLSDSEAGGVRTLTYRGAPEGAIPVRVPDGGRYAYVEVEGLADTADGDPFFNARLQAASLRGDKYILFVHSGGDFTIRLRESTPLYWWPARLLLASFDHVALFTPLNSGDMLMMVTGGLLLVVLLLCVWRLRKREGLRLGQAALTAAITAGIVAVLFALYQLLRLPHVSISTKPMALNLLWVGGVFLLTVSGTALFLLSRGWFARLLSLLVAVIPALVPALFGLAATGGINLLIHQKIGAHIYNTHLGSLPLIAAVVWLLCMWGLLSAVEKHAKLPVIPRDRLTSNFS